MNFAPYADLIWLETKEPDLAQAKSFARRIREKFPGKHVDLFSQCYFLLSMISQ
jgi:isocitrate lyase